ncbi:MAG: bifunctional metallophosphatase/5'-nucleotidase [Candidatus Sericytochromatia bacterium]
MLKLPRMLALLPVAAMLAIAPPAVAGEACCEDTSCCEPKAGAVEKTNVVVMGTTDVHGRIYPTNYYGDDGDEPIGLARAYTLIKELRAKHPHTLLVDSGDCLQGTALTYHNARVDTKPMNPMVEAMNFMKYDAFAVGNHEYNYGLGYLNKAKSEAKYPFLSGNIFKHKTQEPVYKPYVIKEVNGVKIGILGFTTPGVAIWDRRHVEGKQDFRDIIQSAKRWLPEVKAQGVAATIVIIHSGLGDPYDSTFSGYSADAGLPDENVSAALADACPEIDAILLGHSHKDLPKLVRNGVLLAQAQKWGERLAVVDLSFEKQNGAWKLVSKDSHTLDTKGVTPDPEVLSVAKRAHTATVAYVNSVIGQSTGEWKAAHARTQDTAIMDLINEVQRKITGADLAAASVFNDAAKLPKGKVTVSDIAGLYVYENTLSKVELTGQQLRDYLEFSATYFNTYKPGGKVFNSEKRAYNYDMVSGVDYEIDVRKPAGQRITKLTFKGKPVTPGQKFTMAVNSYRQSGGGGFTMFKDAPVKEALYTEIRELMLEYVKTEKVISPEKVFKKNWRIVPEGAIAADGETYK